MRCDCCDVILTPQESVRKFRATGEYTNTCSSCLKHIDMPTVEGRAFDEDGCEYDMDDQQEDWEE